MPPAPGEGIHDFTCPECGKVVMVSELSRATNRDLCASCERVQCALERHENAEDLAAYRASPEWRAAVAELDSERSRGSK